MKALKQVILINIIISIFGLTGNCQDYKKMLTEENSWFYVEAFEVAYTFEYRTIGDTLLNEIEYKKVYYGFANDALYNQPYFLIREDTVSRQVFFVPQSETTECLAYDFGMEVGDTASIPQFDNTSDTVDYILDSISVLSNIGSNNKVFYLSKIEHEESLYDTHIIWIESVGSITGIENNCREWNIPEINTLICAYQNENQTFYYEPNSWFSSGPHNCSIFVGINDVHESAFKVSPNPVSDNLYIIGLSENIQVKIEIIGLNGVKYLCKEIESNSVNVSNLKTGLYFLNIYSNNRKLHSQKFIKL
jgi:hypothetical protein